MTHTQTKRQELIADLKKELARHQLQIHESQVSEIIKHGIDRFLKINHLHNLSEKHLSPLYIIVHELKELNAPDVDSGLVFHPGQDMQYFYEPGEQQPQQKEIK